MRSGALLLMMEIHEQGLALVMLCRCMHKGWINLKSSSDSYSSVFTTSLAFELLPLYCYGEKGSSLNASINIEQ